MSNYPPYSGQPNQPQFGPYPPPQPFPTRMDILPQPTLQQPVQGPQGASMGLSPSSRPVTSREEAMGVAADFSGALMIFPDVANNRVYLKRWDPAIGGPAFMEYVPAIPPQAEQIQPQPQPQAQPSWVSLQDFQELQGVVNDLQKEINGLKKPAGRTASKNDADK